MDGPVALLQLLVIKDELNWSESLIVNLICFWVQNLAITIYDIELLAINATKMNGLSSNQGPPFLSLLNTEREFEF